MKRSVLSLFLAGFLCLPALPAAAQDAAGANEAMGSLRVDRDPVLLSMAGAGFAMTSSNQAYAAFGNPAAAAFSSQKLEAGVSRQACPTAPGRPSTRRGARFPPA